MDSHPADFLEMLKVSQNAIKLCKMCHLLSVMRFEYDLYTSTLDRKMDYTLTPHTFLSHKHFQEYLI